jgi:hypothetical protein
MMVLELASRGDLKHFLLDCRPTQDNEALLNSTHLARMGVDVASGMVFLSANHLVHRDLACRYVRVIALARVCQYSDSTCNRLQQLLGDR